MRRAERQRGAALLVLLTVVALGAASLFISAAGQRNGRDARERKNVAVLNQAREALIGFAVANGRLPRPAASGVDGSEASAACSTDASCTGLLPWSALGIDRADAWGRPIRYSVTPVYTIAPVVRAASVGTKTVLTRDTGGAIRYVAGYPVCAPGTPCLVAVLWSTGRDNFAASNGDEAANNIASADFMRRAISDDPRAPGGEFDDLVAFIAPEQLYQQMARAKVLP